MIEEIKYLVSNMNDRGKVWCGTHYLKININDTSNKKYLESVTVIPSG